MIKEKHVCALKYAKELKELGYPQDDSLWYWIVDLQTQKEHLCRILGKSIYKHQIDYETYAAPTVAELGEVLPNDFMSYKKDDDMWLCCKHHPEIGKNNEMIMEFADIEADARAKMVIFHLKNKCIKVEDL